VVVDPPLRIVFFGTPDFSVPSLDALLSSSHAVVGVVTRHDRPRGRGQRTKEPPVKERGLAAGLPVLQPERLTDSTFLGELAAFRPDLGVVAAYGKILTPGILALPRLGCINVHASLLPRYRGAAPVHRAIIAGEQETGVTIMRMVTALDAGPMLATAKTPIGVEDTSADLERVLARLGASLLMPVIDALALGPVPEVMQDEGAATYAQRITRADGLLDWQQPASAIHNLIRGLHPWPHAFTFHQGRRLILLRSRPLDDPSSLESSETLAPASVLDASGDRLHIATSHGLLAILELQAEGRRSMTTREFLAGSDVRVGDRFSREP
jgi:methionyl-tRNA formyltransferase